MFRIKKSKNTSMSISVGLGIALLISLAITIAGAALTAYLVAAEKIGEGATQTATIITLILAAAAGAWSATALIKRLRLQVCLMSGGLYFLSLLAMTALFFGGQYQGVGIRAILTLAACVAISFIPEKGRRTGRKKRAYR